MSELCKSNQCIVVERGQCIYVFARADGEPDLCGAELDAHHRHVCGVCGERATFYVFAGAAWGHRCIEHRDVRPTKAAP